MKASRAAALGAFGLALGVTQAAEGKPQWNGGLESGVCGASGRLGFEGLGWCNAVHGDVLFLRDSGKDVGLGPSLRLGTARFDDVRLDVGVSLLLPVLQSFPLVLEAGPHLRNFHEPGVFVSAFWGLRSFNHYGHYDMATGISVIAERSFVTGTPSALWVTARVDGSWIALPFVFVYNALR